MPKTLQDQLENKEPNNILNRLDEILRHGYYCDIKDCEVCKVIEEYDEE